MLNQANRRTGCHRAIGALATTLVALVAYVRTAAPGLTWAHSGADGGDLIAASMTWGIPHPSGYPTYMLLSRLWAWLFPLAPIARRFSLFSSACAAFSVGLTFLWVRRLLTQDGTTELSRTICAGGGALVWALGPALWQQAVICEVYTLQMMLTALAWLLAARISEETASRRWATLGFVLGLGLGAHLTTWLCWPGIGLILWRRRQTRHVMALAGGILMGTSVLLYLPLAARQNPPVNWGDAASWPGLTWLLTGRLYQGYLFGLPLSAIPGRLAAWALIWRQQLTLVGMLIAAGGLFMLADASRIWFAATSVTACAYSVLAVTYDTADSHVYLLTALMMGAAWVAFGLLEVGRWMQEQRDLTNRLGPLRHHTAQVATVLLTGGIALVLGCVGLDANDLSQETQATQWLETTLEKLPQDAILVTGQDRHTFAMDYAQWAEGTRQDLIVVDGDLTGFAWYRDQLATRHPGVDFWSPDQDWRQWLADQSRSRATYLSSPRQELDALFHATPEGDLFRLNGAP